LITDKAIESVPKVEINGFTDEQNVFIQKQHKELLKYSRDNNENKEVAFVFKSDLTNKTIFIGSDDVIEFGNGLMGKGDNLFVMHNHPRNSSFSKTDIDEFINSLIKSLSIVKNNGEVVVITKTGAYDFRSAFIAKQRHISKYIVNKTEEEYNIFVDKLLKYYEKKGMVKWIR